jgi:DNA-binding NarL/FixJ family response regulator
VDAMNLTVRVMLIDDEELVRRGLRSALDEAPAVTVIADVPPGSVAVEMIRRLHPEVILTDTRIGPQQSIEFVRRIAAEKWEHSLSIVAITRFDDDDYMFGVLRAGARGFLLKKEATKEELLRSIEAVAAGNAYICPSMTRRLVDRFETLPPPGTNLFSSLLDRLSDREVEVLAGIAAGKSNQEIATDLHLTSATVKSHVSRILGKLRLTNRMQAAVLAYQAGLIPVSIPVS